jgi:hypothetical protein
MHDFRWEEDWVAVMVTIMNMTTLPADNFWLRKLGLDDFYSICSAYSIFLEAYQVGENVKKISKFWLKFEIVMPFKGHCLLLPICCCCCCSDDFYRLFSYFFVVKFSILLILFALFLYYVGLISPLCRGWYLFPSY